MEEAALIRIIDTSHFSPPSPDPAGIVYIPSTGRLLMSDSEVEEMSIFAGVNLYSMTLAGSLVGTSDTMDFSNEPTGLALNSNNGHLFVSDDDANKIFEVAAGNDGKYGTSDDSVTSFSTSSFSGDSEDVGFDPVHNTLYVSDGVGKEIYRITPGNDGVFDGPAPGGDDSVTHFDVAVLGAQDPEGVAFNPTSGTLFVLDYGSKLIIETTTSGAFIRSIGIGQSSLSHPEDITFAPGSLDPNSWHAYITTRGVDNNSNPNENDGKVYEMAFSGLAPPGNQAPSVSAGPDQTVGIVSGVVLDGTVSDDGKPAPPAAVTSAWSKLSGPGSVTFGNLANVDTTASFGATGSYVLRLTANDSELAASDDISVDVVSGSFVTLQSQVAASSDDAEEDTAGNVSLTSSDLELVMESTLQTVGMRFTSVAIPKGSVIQSAYIQFQTDETSSTATSLTFRGQAIDNAPTFTTAAANISGRSKTVTAATWVPAAWSVVGEMGPAQQTIDMGPVLQEIVSRPGWNSGNAIAIIVTGSGKRTATAYNGSPAGAPILLVQYGASQPSNQAPSVNAGPDQSVSLAAGAVLDGTVTDDGLPNPPAALTTAWSKLSGPGTVGFGNASAVDTTASFSAAGAYVLRLTANDGALAVSDDLSITVASSNQAPSVNAGPDQSVSLASGATLDGTVSDDGLPSPPGALTTSWSKLSGPGTVNFASSGAVDTTASFSVAGSYVLRLTANDSALSSSDDVGITVAPPVNQPPSVGSGPDQAVELALGAALNGTITDDGLPNPPAAVTSTWSKLSGPGTVGFSNASAVDTTASFSALGTYVLRLTADDGALQSSDDATITVLPNNHAPSVAAGPDLSVVKDTGILLDATVSDDGLPNPPGTLTTLWTKVSGSGGVAFTNANAVDTMVTFHKVGSFVVRLTANDGTLSTSDDVTITVTPKNQAPAVYAGPDRSVGTGIAASMTATVTDDGLPNPPNAVTLAWTSTLGPGTVTFSDPSVPDAQASFSTPGTYVLTLSADDGELTASDDLIVVVTQVNQPPVVDAGSDQSIGLGEPAVLAGTVSDDGLPDPPLALTVGWTAVSGPGRVDFTNGAAADTLATFSVAGTYVLRLTADDGALDTSDDVSITVVPNNQAPVVEAGPEQVVSFDLGAVLDATVIDDALPDPPLAVTTSWTTVSGPGPVVFAAPGAVDTTASFPAPGSYVLRLTADDGALVSSDDTSITVTPGIFADLGGAALGIDGAPTLTAKGPLTVGSTLTLALQHAAPGAPVLLGLSLSSVPLNVFGGTLYANPMAAQFLFASDASGALALSAAWPAAFPAGTDVYFQYLIRDVSVAGGITLSNAVTAQTP